MDHDTIPFGSATAIVAAISEGRLSARAALEQYLERVEQQNALLNAVVVLRSDEARAEADAADRDRAAGVCRGPLHGLPMTVKESFQLTGTPTTWGLPKLAGTTSTRDAVVIRRLRQAGAVIFGKSNVPRLLADWQTYNEVYGVTNNPWDTSRSPGGSSGGAAAALAAGFTGLELGTDIGSSIRNPAHYCGVYGHKPTFDIVTQYGHAPDGVVAEPDLGVVGPLGRSAADLELGLDVIAGPDDIDAAAWRLTLPPARRPALREFRIAVMMDSPRCPVDADITGRLQHLVDFLGWEGARLSVGAWPSIDPDELWRVYLRLLRAATSRRYTSAEVVQFRAEVGSSLSDSLDYWQISREATVMGHRDWLLMNEFRHKMRLQWQAFFREFDVLLCPVASTTAMRHDPSEPRHERQINVNGQSMRSIDQLFWSAVATTCYLPATVAPIGLSGAGLPVGVQIIGPQYGDKTTIAFAKLLEREFYAFVPPPRFTD